MRHPRTIDDKTDLIHDFHHLMCTRAIDGEKAMSRGILRGKQAIKLPIRVVEVKFAYSIKTRRKINSLEKCTVRVPYYWFL